MVKIVFRITLYFITFHFRVNNFKKELALRPFKLPDVPLCIHGSCANVALYGDREESIGASRAAGA